MSLTLQQRVAIGALCLVLPFCSLVPRAAAEESLEDLTPRLQAIYEHRARWLLTDENPPPLESDYLPDSGPARWALDHEHGKIKYMRQWSKNRGVRFVEAKPTIRVKRLRANPERVRFYVEQSLALGYTYPNEPTPNMFGVGTRHIIELRKKGDQWLIGMEWYTDPLGDDTEVPDVTPAFLRTPTLSAPPAAVASREVAARGYNRAGAVEYADQYCGVAWGCGNSHRYNPRFRDFNGVGGDCTNYVSQALAVGGGLRLPIYTKVDALAGHLRYSGRADLAARGHFRQLMKAANNRPGGFPAWIKTGDLFAYQEKGEMAHFAIVTGFDSHGYPLVNSHTADRYHVPFDLGWDRKTIYWLFQMRD